MMSDFLVTVQADVDVPASVAAELERAVLTTLRHQAVVPPAALTLLLTDDEEMHRLNHDFLGVDKPTDVLSFPAGDGPARGRAVPYMGDIAVSVPTAERQAAAAGHSPLAELQLLTVHGVLHLLGYDHTEAEEKKVMWEVQAAILAQLGLSHVTPAES